jgi:hypothetical protein
MIIINLHCLSRSSLSIVPMSRQFLLEFSLFNINLTTIFSRVTSLPNPGTTYVQTPAAFVPVLLGPRVCRRRDEAPSQWDREQMC